MFKKSKKLFSALLALVLVYTSTTVAHASEIKTFSGDSTNYQIQTTYAGTITEYVIDENDIEKYYGKTARDLYVQGVQTGDYVPFRTHLKTKDSANALIGVKYAEEGNPLAVGMSTAMSYESAALAWLGPYATVQDYITWVTGLGYAPIGDNNRMAADFMAGKFQKPAQITKAQYQKNKKASATATAPASNSQVEALKTYKGNTSEFNAYYYYTNYADLQGALGANGDALLKHYNTYGKAEGRVANKIK